MAVITDDKMDSPGQSRIEYLNGVVADSIGAVSPELPMDPETGKTFVRIGGVVYQVVSQSFLREVSSDQVTGE